MGLGQLALVALGIVVVALVATIAVLRWRKLRRDDVRRLGRHPALIAPPPSPYEISKAVRLLDDGAQIQPRPEPVRPRLDPERPYVFTDGASFDTAAGYNQRSRHDSRWALERSSHRSRFAPGSGKIIAAVIVALMILFAVGAYLQRSTPHPTTTTTTTTTTVPQSTTTSSVPG